MVTALLFTAAIYFLFGQPVISLFISGTKEEIAIAIPVGLHLSAQNACFMPSLRCGLPGLFFGIGFAHFLEKDFAPHFVRRSKTVTAGLMQ